MNSERDHLILEGLVTTVDRSDRVNIAPMGPVVDRAIERFRFRPFQTSTTFRNLEQMRQGIFHVTDDVELLARAAVGELGSPPRMFRAEAVDGYILADACRWYAFCVEAIDKQDARAEVEVRVVDCGTQREFFGFNRAKHAVLEAAILATRLEITPADAVRREFERLSVIVEKTGGAQEHRAFGLLERYLAGVTGDC